MYNDTMMRALFAQQRTQILYIKSTAPHMVSDAYAYAWKAGVYPLFQDKDYSIPHMPHASFKEQFLVSPQLCKEVTDYLDLLWGDLNSRTLYELENKFGGKDNRSQILAICRYAYLDGFGDEILWGSVLNQDKRPTEARDITQNSMLTNALLHNLIGKNFMLLQNFNTGDIVGTDFIVYQHWSLVSDSFCKNGLPTLISATNRTGTV